MPNRTAAGIASNPMLRIPPAVHFRPSTLPGIFVQVDKLLASAAPYAGMRKADVLQFFLLSFEQETYNKVVSRQEYDGYAPTFNADPSGEVVRLLYDLENEDDWKDTFAVARGARPSNSTDCADARRRLQYACAQRVCNARAQVSNETEGNMLIIKRGTDPSRSWTDTYGRCWTCTWYSPAIPRAEPAHGADHQVQRETASHTLRQNHLELRTAWAAFLCMYSCVRSLLPL